MKIIKIRVILQLRRLIYFLGSLLGNSKRWELFCDLIFVLMSGVSNSSNVSLRRNGENALARKLSSLSDSHFILFDIGCASGAYTQLYLDAANPFQGKIIAVDANKLALEDYASNHAKLIPTQITLVNAAISGEDSESKTFYIPVDRALQEKGSLADMSLIGIPIDSQEAFVKVMSLPSLIDSMGLEDIQQKFRLRILKMDVEGAEYPILNSSHQLLAQKFFDVIQFEFGLASRAFRWYFKDLYDLLQNYQYEVFVIKTKRIAQIRNPMIVDNYYTYGNFVAISRHNSSLLSKIYPLSSPMQKGT